MEELKEKNSEKERNYRDGELCLRVCHAISKGVVTARDIHDVIQYEGSYENFRSALSKIKKRGYIRFSNNQKLKNPFKQKRSYALTVKGEKFLQNPNEKWERKQARFHARMMKLLEQQPEFITQLSQERAKMKPEKVIEYVNRNIGTNYNDIGQVNQLLEGIDNFKYTLVGEDVFDDSTLRLEELRRKYNALVIENQNLKNNSVNKPAPRKLSNENPKNYQREYERTKLTNIRKQLVKECYNTQYLDIRFFKIWQNIVPAKIKGAKMFAKNSVEFISSGNKEFKRGHAKEMDEYQISSSCFYIMKVENDGIIIGGKGVGETGEKIKF